MKINVPVFFKKGRVEHFLILDIGTEAVKALIFKAEAEKVIILGFSLQYLDEFGIFDSQDFKSDITKKAISRAIEEIKKTANKTRVGSLLLSLPADILLGEINFQFFQRKNPKEIIDRKEEEAICQEILEDSKKQISQNFALKTGILPQDIQFYRLKILGSKIDGYEVPYLQDFDGKNLSFRILAIFLPKNYFQELENIFKTYNFKKINIIHEVEGLRFLVDGISNGIFLDIGGEITQIFLVNNGELQKIDSFDIGGKAFSRALSQTLGLPEQEARLLKERYSQGELSEGVRKRVKEILSPTIQDWLWELKLKLKEVKSLLPSTIFLFGGGSSLPEFQEILREGAWEDFSFATLPEVRYLQPKDLKNIEDRNNLLRSPQDTSCLLIGYAPKNI